MRFRRKAAASPPEDAAAAEPDPVPDGSDQVGGGPYDVADVADDGVERIDLGSLLITPERGLELRLQVDQATEVVHAVLLAGSDGALELRAFAAPRGGDLWSEARPQIAAETTGAGGTAAEREGRFGTELLCERPVRTADGRTGVQTARIVGVNGPRWLLQATFVGSPATDPDGSAAWEETLASVVVNRGAQALPPGDALPLTLPPDARRAR